jgi:hypothetical protein
MAEPSAVEVAVEIDGRELVAGTLWVHERGKPTASFRYSDSFADLGRQLASPEGDTRSSRRPLSKG